MTEPIRSVQDLAATCAHDREMTALRQQLSEAHLRAALLRLQVDELTVERDDEAAEHDRFRALLAEVSTEWSGCTSRLGPLDVDPACGECLPCRVRRAVVP